MKLPRLYQIFDKTGIVSIHNLIFTIFVLFASISAKADIGKFSDESLRYVISYKWGIVHKDAGDAELSLRRHGDRYDLKLTAKTKPWADNFYRVRDTLISQLRVSDFKPILYEKRTHEKDMYDLDRVVYSHSGAATTGQVTRTKHRKNGVKTNEMTLSSTGPTYDMLSLFYYLRKLDYSKLDKYRAYTATVFSGTQKETVKIKSLGKEMLTMRDKSKREAYHIRFNFTRDGGKKSSDDIDAWISADDRHIPLYLVGKLPVGEVRVYLQ